MGILWSGGIFDSAAIDTHGDRKPDQWQYFEGSKTLKGVEFDTNGDGEVDRWEFYNGTGKLDRIELDRNFDGKVDTVNRK